MTLQQLRYFLAACQHGSFAAAADALYLAQPSLADQVRRLERELRVALFVRSGRRLTLTEAGKTFRPHAQKVLAAVEVAAASVGQVRELQGGTASMGTFGVAHHFFVREVVAEFAERYPEVTVRVVGQNTVEVCEKIRNGELEVGLVTMPFDDTGLDVRPVLTDENLYCAVEGPDVGEPMTIERLARTRLILYDAHYGWRDPTRSQLVARARAAGITLRPAIEVESLDSALRLAAQGLGGTFALRTVVEEANFPPELRSVPFEPGLYDTFSFVSRRGAQMSPATDELMRLTELQLKCFGLPVFPPDGELLEF